MRDIQHKSTQNDPVNETQVQSQDELSFTPLPEVSPATGRSKLPPV